MLKIIQVSNYQDILVFLHKSAYQDISSQKNLRLGFFHKQTNQI